MTVTLRDARDSTSDRDWVRAIYRDYLSELSASKTGLFPVLGEWPTREDEFLAAWFNDSTSHPFVILSEGDRVGFALVSRPADFPRPAIDHRMAEFFIVAGARRRGIGASAAALLFSRFQGEWEVVEDEYNRAALGFWRRVIARQTQGRYTEQRNAGEVSHRFRTTVRPEPGPST